MIANRIKKALICACLMSLSGGHLYAKEWRGITPLHSTCEDIRRILGIEKCETSLYYLSDASVFIWFSKKPCIDGWNVPPGTVTAITVYPKSKIQLADLAIDESAFKKRVNRHPAGSTRYINADEGFIIDVFPDGAVESLSYIPAAKDSHLRFPGSLAEQREHDDNNDGDTHKTRIFDQYEVLAVKNEQERLGDFALRLRSEPNSQGYIIAYAGRRAHVGEAQANAKGTKDILVNRYGIKNERFVIVDGGYREESMIELFVRLDGGTRPIAFPTVCPTEVQIIKASNIGNSKVRSSRSRSK